MQTHKHEILSDKRTVWVNSGETGSCLARFGPNGIDIHHDIGHGKDTECLSCTHEPATPADWQRFVREMKKFYDVVIGEEHKPTWLKE